MRLLTYNNPGRSRSWDGYGYALRDLRTEYVKEDVLGPSRSSRSNREAPAALNIRSCSAKFHSHRFGRGFSMIQKIGHIGRYCGDMEKMKWFHTDVLEGSIN